MNKKKWLIIGGVALASILLVVAAFAARGTEKDPGELAGGGASSVEASDATGGASSDQTNSADSATSADGTASSDPSSATAGDDGATGEGAATIAEAGKPLKRVVQPPEHTLAMLDPNVAKAGTSYEIVFKPYGTGPQSGGLTVAALVVTAKLRDPSAKAPDLAGRNVLLVLSSGEVVENGGSYRATLTLTERDETLLPVVSNVHPAD